MTEPIIFWHRVNSGDYATKLFDHFLHVKRHGDDDYYQRGWFVTWDKTIVIQSTSFDVAFDVAEAFYRNEMIKRTDEPCL